MAEKPIDGTSVASGGGTASGTCTIASEQDRAVLVVNGDSNTTDLDIAVTGTGIDPANSLVGINFGGSVTGLDATTDANNDVAVAIDDLTGVADIEITVTNNAASATTVTVKQVDF